MSNVVLTPHTAGITEETLNRLNMFAAQNMLKVLKAEKPENLVNPDVWPAYRRRLENMHRS